MFVYMCVFFCFDCMFVWLFLFVLWLSVCLSVYLSLWHSVYICSFLFSICLHVFVCLGFFFSECREIKNNFPQIISSLAKLGDSFLAQNIQYLSIPKPISFSLFLCLSVYLSVSNSFFIFLFPFLCIMSVCLFVCLTFSLYLPLDFSLPSRLYFQCRQIHTNSPKKFRASRSSANCHFSQIYY